MYRGFELDLKNVNLSAHMDAGRVQYNEYKRLAEADLDLFISPDGIIDGKKLEQEWFPNITAHIFISHSHNDLDMAIGFAGWLNQNFQLTCFIDSCIWGHTNVLQKRIDERFTKNTSGETYDYDKRNYSTSHVNMMLSMALTKMIDNCECLFFLNTPQSVNVADVVEQSTYSPWIYAEMTTAKYIEKKMPPRLLDAIKKSFSADKLRALDENLTIKLPLELDHLVKVKVDDMNKWRNAYNRVENTDDALKVLYKQHGN